MHELSIAMSILDLVAEEAAHREGRVTAVHLKLGPLAGVVRDALVSAFDLARETSATPQVSLVIEDVPIVVHCAACDTDQALPSLQEMRCPACGAPAVDIRTGRELEVVALELTS
jgi:hydrogenase nickel incorporation protein HypA/HybF